MKLYEITKQFKQTMFFLRRLILNICLLLILFVFLSCTQKLPNKEGSRIQEKSSSYIPGIIAKGDTLTKLIDKYKFDTAGSPLYLNGALYFTNNNFEKPEESRTLKINANGEIDTLAIDNGVTTTLQASGKGTIYACQMLGHKVVELDTDGKILRVVADKYKGKRIDGPNDIVVDSQGGLYFSDSQFIAGATKMQETPAVYYVSADGEILRVISNIEFPNGLALSPDGSVLYVANTQGRYLLAFDVNDDGTVDNRRDFAQFELPEDSESSGADGMAVDSEGNIYVATTNGLGIQIFDNKGNHIGKISCPSPTNNISFGGSEGDMIFVSAQDGIYSIKTEVEGLFVE